MASETWNCPFLVLRLIRYKTYLKDAEGADFGNAFVQIAFKILEFFFVGHKYRAFIDWDVLFLFVNLGKFAQYFPMVGSNLFTRDLLRKALQNLVLLLTLFLEGFWGHLLFFSRVWSFNMSLTTFKIAFWPHIIVWSDFQTPIRSIWSIWTHFKRRRFFSALRWNHFFKIELLAKWSSFDYQIYSNYWYFNNIPILCN